jgi:hypothetical protein
VSEIRRIFGKPGTGSRVSPRRGGNPSFRAKINWAPRLNKRGELVPRRHGLPLPFLAEFAESLVEALDYHRGPLEQRHEPVDVTPNRLKLISYDQEHEVVELETFGSLFFDILASLLDAIDQKLILDRRSAHALARLLRQWRVREHAELRSFEISLTWRRRDHSAVFDKQLFDRLEPLIVKEGEQRANVSLEQSRLWRAKRFVHVAHESAFSDLSRDLDARGLTCFVLDGSRIADFSSFEEEGFSAGIFDPDDWGHQPLDLIVPHRSAIIWRRANRLLEADPVALVEAVHSILSNRRSPGSGQVEVFLLGGGSLLTGHLLTVPGGLSDELKDVSTTRREENDERR